jgi:hypothetical protein
MNIKIHEINGDQIAEIVAEEVVISGGQDALDIMANLYSRESKGIIIHEYNLPQDFFALHTGVAGEILQKFSQYLIRIAIIGDFEKYESKSLQAFIGESNRGNQVFFVKSFEVALSRLSAAPDLRNQILRR